MVQDTIRPRNRLYRHLTIAALRVDTNSICISKTLKRSFLRNQYRTSSVPLVNDPIPPRNFIAASDRGDVCGRCLLCVIPVDKFT